MRAGVAGAALVLALGRWMAARHASAAPRTRPEAQRGGAPLAGPVAARGTKHYTGTMKILVKWLLSASALLLVAYLYSGVQVEALAPH